MQEKYRELVRWVRQVRNQAQRFSEEIRRGVKRGVNQKPQAVRRGMKQELDAMIPLVNQVLRQTTARVFRGITDTPGKIVSVFEPTAEIIRKGKVSKPTEFGKLLKDSGSRESDYYPLRGVPAAAGRRDLAAGSGAPASATRAVRGEGFCRLGRQNHPDPGPPDGRSSWSCAVS
jgi:hypothetical protein